MHRTPNEEGIRQITDDLLRDPLTKSGSSLLMVVPGQSNGKGVEITGVKDVGKEDIPNLK